jgi:hypothetical protein
LKATTAKSEDRELFDYEEAKMLAQLALKGKFSGITDPRVQAFLVDLGIPVRRGEILPHHGNIQIEHWKALAVWAGQQAYTAEHLAEISDFAKQHKGIQVQAIAAAKQQMPRGGVS